VGLTPKHRLPWIEAAVLQALKQLRSHAMLVVAPAGLGEYDFVTQLAQALLCEARAGQPVLACGQCPGCRLFVQGAHADLMRLLPEALRAADAAENTADDGGKASKKKPSQQIRIDEVRIATEWMSRTSSRGGAKVVLVHPAESMNTAAASALLKNLEEPSPGVTLLLTVSDLERVMPTVRSRCQVWPLEPPPAAVALAWLKEQGVAQPEVMLRAASGRPVLALQMVEAGMDAERWMQIPRRLLRADPSALAGLELPGVIDTLLKVCHDAWAHSLQAPAAYFPPESLPAAVDALALATWQRELARLARQSQHPWNEGLMLERLALEAQKALQSPVNRQDAKPPARTTLAKT
jgi:DNA polymerase III subunit delta'